jgi:type IV pilus assembly protein PilA
MFQRFHEAMKERDEGFTLIELLVVILIIAILAAIAIPVFLNQRKKGWDAQSQSALKDASLAVETYGAANNGSFLGMNTESATTAGVVSTGLASNGYNPTSNVNIKVAADAQGYCITSYHKLSTNYWYYTSTKGTPILAGTTATFPANTPTCLDPTTT